jgi:hypothetical protein
MILIDVIWYSKYPPKDEANDGEEIFDKDFDRESNWQQ